MLFNSGAMASFSGLGASAAIFPANAAVVLAGSRPPVLFTRPRTALINWVRAATSASRLRITARSACDF